MESLNNFLSLLEEKLMPVAGKMASNRYLSAIRDGFIAIMPITIVGSFFYLINAVILGDTGIFMNLFGNPFSTAMQLGASIIPATFSMMALLATFTIAKSLATFYKEDTSILPTVAVSSLFILMPITFNDGLEMEIVNTKYTGSAGLFLAFICAFGSVELIRLFSRVKWLRIKMPEAVPSNVSSSFSNLIPIAFTLIIFGMVRVLTNMIGIPLNDLIFELLQVPFTNIVTSPLGIVVIYFFYMLLWGFGIHTAFIFSPILTPVYLNNITENAQAISSGAEATNLMTQTFIDMTTQIGGAGNMLGLIIAIFIFSKRADYKQIAKLGFVPALFNISEPIMFGLPVVMNPILIIPMILSSLASLGIGAFATVIGLMDYTFVVTTSVIPAGILGFIGTGGDIGSIIVTILILGVSVLIYAPFVRIMNKQLEVEESKVEGEINA